MSSRETESNAAVTPKDLLSLFEGIKRDCGIHIDDEIVNELEELERKNASSRISVSSLSEEMIETYEQVGCLYDLYKNLATNIQDTEDSDDSDHVPKKRKLTMKKPEPKPVLFEADGRTPVRVFDTNDMSTMKNWGGNIIFYPKFLFMPKTIKGTQNVVIWAKNNNYRIRVSAYQHTWANVYTDENQIQISFLSYEHLKSDLSSSQNSTGAGPEFSKIELIEGTQTEQHIHCKVGAAVTNDDLRIFCENTVDQKYKYNWSIPINSILVENTICGTVSSICHGAGSSHKTLADLVVRVEFINADGNLQVIEEADLLKSTAGCFGLIGVIVSVTIRLDRMNFAKMEPEIVNVLRAIPPPKGTLVENLPKEIVSKNKLTQNMLDRIIEEETPRFAEACESNYYAEWFWFIYNDDCWVNCWKMDDIKNYDKNKKQWKPPGQHIQNLVNILMSKIAPLINNDKLRLQKGSKWVTEIIGSAIMRLLQFQKPKKPIPLPEALHFQRGIRTMHVRDCEMEIPVPKIKDNKIDWTVCQRAWWDAIIYIYKLNKQDPTIPINLTLEMRIMNGSDITLAAQKGNHCSAAIEVLSTLRCPYINWRAAASTIMGQWTTYTDSDNNKLKSRPHWAKEWDGMTFGSTDARAFVKNSYRDVLPVFLEDLRKVAEKGGYKLEDMKRVFSNNFFDDIIYSSH